MHPLAVSILNIIVIFNGLVNFSLSLSLMTVSNGQNGCLCAAWYVTDVKHTRLAGRFSHGLNYACMELELELRLIIYYNVSGDSRLTWWLAATFKSFEVIRVWRCRTKMKPALRDYSMTVKLSWCQETPRRFWFTAKLYMTWFTNVSF